jgi:hypothetical protein
LILNEVFECDDPEDLAKRGDAFFGMLPAPEFRAPLASSSPMNAARLGVDNGEQPAERGR